MTVFNVIEKQQKSRFCLQFSLLKSSLQTQKSTFTAKFSPSSSLEVIFLLLFLAGAELQPLILVHTDLEIFSLLKSEKFFFCEPKILKFAMSSVLISFIHFTIPPSFVVLKKTE